MIVLIKLRYGNLLKLKQNVNDLTVVKHLNDHCQLE